MKTKTLLSFLSAAVLVSTLTACAQPSERPTPEGGFIKEQTTVNVWVKSDANSDLYKSFAEEFKEVEPNVNVIVSALEDVGNYNELQQKVLVGFNAGQYPNIVQAYPGHVADYMFHEKALNMKPYMDNAKYGWTDYEKSQFNLESGSQFGIPGQYSLPFNRSSEVLYYNRDKLVGLDLSSVNIDINNGRPLTDAYLQNLTWEEIFEKLGPALIQYDEENPDLNLIDKSDEDWSIIFHEDDANHFITTLKQYDIPYTSVDEEGNGKLLFVNDEAKALKKKFAQYCGDHLLGTRWSSGGKYSANQLLLGHSLLAVNSTVGASYFYHDDYITDIGIGHVPYAKGHKRYVVEQGTSLGFLTHGDANQDLAAWLFYKYMTSYDNQLRYSLQSGYLPIRADIYNDPAYINENDLSKYSTVSAKRIQAQVFNFAKELEGDYFTEAPFVGSTAARNACSYLNSGLYSAGKNGTLTDQLIDEEFTKAYNNAVNDA